MEWRQDPRKRNDCIVGLGRGDHLQPQSFLVCIIPQKKQQRTLECAGSCGQAETCSDDQAGWSFLHPVQDPRSRPPPLEDSRKS